MCGTTTMSYLHSEISPLYNYYFVHIEIVPYSEDNAAPVNITVCNHIG